MLLLVTSTTIPPLAPSTIPGADALASETDDPDNGSRWCLLLLPRISVALFDDDMCADIAPLFSDTPVYRQGLSGRDLAVCPLLLLLLLLLILLLLPRPLKKRENGKLDCFDDDLETPLDAAAPDKASWDALIPCTYGKFNKLILLFLLDTPAVAAPPPAPPPAPPATAAELLSLSGTSKAVLFGGGFIYVLVSSACEQRREQCISKK